MISLFSRRPRLQLQQAGDLWVTPSPCRRHVTAPRYRPRQNPAPPGGARSRSAASARKEVHGPSSREASAPAGSLWCRGRCRQRECLPRRVTARWPCGRASSQPPTPRRDLSAAHRRIRQLSVLSHPLDEGLRVSFDFRLHLLADVQRPGQIKIEAASTLLEENADQAGACISLRTSSAGGSVHETPTSRVRHLEEVTDVLRLFITTLRACSASSPSATP